MHIRCHSTYRDLTSHGGLMLIGCCSILSLAEVADIVALSHVNNNFDITVKVSVFKIMSNLFGNILFAVDKLFNVHYFVAFF